MRVAESVEGFEGIILTHEVSLYMGDAVPMAAVMIVFDIWCPSNFSKQVIRTVADGESADSSVEVGKAESYRKRSFHGWEKDGSKC